MNVYAVQFYLIFPHYCCVATMSIQWIDLRQRVGIGSGLVDALGKMFFFEDSPLALMAAVTDISVNSA